MQTAVSSVAENPPGTAVPGAEGQNWDVSGVPMEGDPGVEQDFSELVEVQQQGPKSRAALYVVLAVLLAPIGYFAYEYLVNGVDPMTLVEGWMGSGAEPTEPTEPRVAQTPAATQPVTQTTQAPAVKTVPGNPYWPLPNRILGQRAAIGRIWTTDEEEAFRGGLANRYVYQHFRTVQAVRQQRLRGSDIILWEALQDRKFWTRMFAAIGLAELNVEISLKNLEATVVGARSELIATFFERFVEKPTPATLFIMRQMVRILDERGRLVVLRAIYASDDELRDLYLVAATQDPGRHVRQWITKALRRKPIPQARFDELTQVVQGSIAYRAAAGGKGRAAAPTEKPLSASEIERELAKFGESGGTVEFHESEATKKDADAQSDAETFDGGGEGDGGDGGDGGEPTAQVDDPSLSG
jgi:hypothetical protein